MNTNHLSVEEILHYLELGIIEPSRDVIRRIAERTSGLVNEVERLRAEKDLLQRRVDGDLPEVEIDWDEGCLD